MKKREKKLELHRDTIARLDPLEIRSADLERAQGGSIVVLSSTVPRGCHCPVQTGVQ